MTTDIHQGARIALTDRWEALVGMSDVTVIDAENAWDAGEDFTHEGRIYRPTAGRIAILCECEGALHAVNCWWSYWHDDGRNQALGDPVIDDPQRRAWRDHPWPPIES